MPTGLHGNRRRGTPCGCPCANVNYMYDPNVHHRRSLRWHKHDYASPGGYYATICVEGFRCLFGNVSAGVMDLNEAGRMVDSHWRAIPARFPAIQLDEWVVMPNHFHGILHIAGTAFDGALERAGTRPAPTLGDAIGSFKSLTTDGYIIGVRQLRWPGFERRVWERNFYDHVIRNDDELEKIRQYIRRNPLMWTCDRCNPESGVLVVSDTGGLMPWEQT